MENVAMTKFQEKSNKLCALESVWDDIQNRIDNETSWLSDDNDEWAQKRNEEANYRISVYKDLQAYLEKQI